RRIRGGPGLWISSKDKKRRWSFCPCVPVTARAHPARPRVLAQQETAQCSALACAQSGHCCGPPRPGADSVSVAVAHDAAQSVLSCDARRNGGWGDCPPGDESLSDRGLYGCFTDSKNSYIMTCPYVC